MRKLITWFSAQDRNERNYWLGLGLLFAGLAVSVSIGTALAVAGGVIVGEAILTSYLAQFIKVRKSNAPD